MPNAHNQRTQHGCDMLVRRRGRPARGIHRSLRVFLCRRVRVVCGISRASALPGRRAVERCRTSMRANHMHEIGLPCQRRDGVLRTSVRQCVQSGVRQWNICRWRRDSPLSLRRCLDRRPGGALRMRFTAHARPMQLPHPAAINHNNPMDTLDHRPSHQTPLEECKLPPQQSFTQDTPRGWVAATLNANDHLAM